MKQLKELSTEELKAELERREKKLNIPPTPLDSPNLHKLKKALDDYFKDLARDGHSDEDCADYIYEAAIEAFYGDDVWPWINGHGK